MAEAVCKLDVILNPRAILDSVESEDSLLDQSGIESIYEIRKLKAAVYYGDKTIIHGVKADKHGQIYLEKFSIWLQSNMYEIH